MQAAHRAARSARAGAGGLLQEFDHNSDANAREFSSIAFNAAGQTVAVGNYNRFYVFAYDTARERWAATPHTQIDNLLTVTALCWKPDG